VPISMHLGPGHRVYTEDVGGSIPSPPTIFIKGLASEIEVTLCRCELSVEQFAPIGCSAPFSQPADLRLILTTFATSAEKPGLVLLYIRSVVAWSRWPRKRDTFSMATPASVAAEATV
jgi:hypothetical protein